MPALVVKQRPYLSYSSQWQLDAYLPYSCCSYMSVIWASSRVPRYG